MSELPDPPQPQQTGYNHGGGIGPAKASEGPRRDVETSAHGPEQTGHDHGGHLPPVQAAKGERRDGVETSALGPEQSGHDHGGGLSSPLPTVGPARQS